jgi:leader peptidase (prepilin peptidase) / N-methyltransferase
MSIYPWIWSAFFGWLLGLLVNYLADVLPIRRRLSRPFCLNCGTDTPLLRYFFYQGRCPYCNEPKRRRVWLVDLFLLGLSLFIVYENPLPLSNWFSLLLISYLLLVTVIDLEHRLVLHITSLFGGFYCFAVGIWLHGLGATILGGLAGVGIMFGIYLLGIVFLRLFQKRNVRQMANSEAIGFGDVILSGVIGLLLGWPGITMGVMLAVLIGGGVSLVVLVWNRIQKTYRPDLAVPYAPFLTISAFILLFIRNWIR